MYYITSVLRPLLRIGISKISLLLPLWIDRLIAPKIYKGILIALKAIDLDLIEAGITSKSHLVEVAFAALRASQDGRYSEKEIETIVRLALRNFSLDKLLSKRTIHRF